jgi:hypothetical protein
MSTTLRRVAFAGAVVLGAALPAAASAATPPSLISSASPAGRYRVSVSAFSSKYIAVTFVRGSGKNFQEHAVMGAGTYSAKANLSSARLRARYGSHGKVSMRFRATGPVRLRRNTVRGCTGKPSRSRRGVLSGTVKVKIKGRIKAVKHSLPATLYKSGTIRCRPGALGPSMTATAPTTTGGGLVATWSRVRKAVFVTASSTEFSPGRSWTVSHLISSTAKSGALKVSGTSATGRAAGPWLGGALTFRAAGPGSTPRFLFGTITGTFVARFDTGRRTMPRGSRGTLSK